MKGCWPKKQGDNSYCRSCLKSNLDKFFELTIGGSKFPGAMIVLARECWVLLSWSIPGEHLPKKTKVDEGRGKSTTIIRNCIKRKTCFFNEIMMMTTKETSLNWIIWVVNCVFKLWKEPRWNKNLVINPNKQKIVKELKILYKKIQTKLISKEKSPLTNQSNQIFERKKTLIIN